MSDVYVFIIFTGLFPLQSGLFLCNKMQKKFGHLLIGYHVLGIISSNLTLLLSAGFQLISVPLIFHLNSQHTVAFNL